MKSVYGSYVLFSKVQYDRRPPFEIPINSICMATTININEKTILIAYTILQSINPVLLMIDVAPYTLVVYKIVFYTIYL